MISRVEALDYRCLKYVRQDLDRVHVLVGPNGSGKSAFLDVLALMSDVVFEGPQNAVAARSEAEDVRDLVWMRRGDRFELVVEVLIPEDRRTKFKNGGFKRARYELALGVGEGRRQPAIVAETFWLIAGERPQEGPAQRSLFPEPPEAPPTILQRRKAPKGWKKIVMKVADSGNDYFYSETSGWNNLFRLGPQKSALANLPEDEVKFPVATWFKGLLMLGVQRMMLNGERMRRPAPPRGPRVFLPDGSTLPWVVRQLAGERSKRFDHWIRHVRTALPDLQTVRTVERREDRHRYLVLKYASGLEVPSWSASDGTLRLLALTLLAYLPGQVGVFLIEEPENGIHPRAVETVFQSLSSVYDAQVLLATHSPVLVSVAKPEQVLCFGRSAEGATDIVRGSEHPALKQWRGETDLGTLFAGGVLG